uniref:Uncharacterized protein n=1 Tax=Arion vulgaris TaxID=1028688 RepID=A0A0B7AYX0_9EUPU
MVMEDPVTSGVHENGERSGTDYLGTPWWDLCLPRDEEVPTNMKNKLSKNLWLTQTVRGPY